MGEGGRAQLVASEEQVAEVRRRGFEVRLESGPHPSARAAEDALDDAWEWPHAVGAAEEAEERDRAERQRREEQQALSESREQSAAQGDPHALLSLATSDEHNGNLQRAAERFRMAAEAGLAGAQ